MLFWKTLPLDLPACADSQINNCHRTIDSTFNFLSEDRSGLRSYLLSSSDVVSRLCSGLAFAVGEPSCDYMMIAVT